MDPNHMPLSNLRIIPLPTPCNQFRGFELPFQSITLDQILQSWPATTNKRSMYSWRTSLRHCSNQMRMSHGRTRVSIGGNAQASRDNTSPLDPNKCDIWYNVDYGYGYGEIPVALIELRLDLTAFDPRPLSDRNNSEGHQTSAELLSPALLPVHWSSEHSRGCSRQTYLCEGHTS